MRIILSLLFCLSCTTFDQRDYRSEAKRVVKPLIKELLQVQSLEDLQRSSSSLEKRFNKIVDLLSATYGQEFCDEKGFDEISNQLEAQMRRIYQINGCKQRMLEIQSDALFRLDKCHRRFNKGG